MTCVLYSNKEQQILEKNILKNIFILIKMHNIQSIAQSPFIRKFVYHVSDVAFGPFVYEDVR